MKARIELLELVANVDQRTGRTLTTSHYEPVKMTASSYTDSDWEKSVACDLVLTSVAEATDVQAIAEKKAKLASTVLAHGYAVCDATEVWASEKRDALKLRVYRTARGEEF